MLPNKFGIFVAPVLKAVFKTQTKIPESLWRGFGSNKTHVTQTQETQCELFVFINTAVISFRH